MSAAQDRRDLLAVLKLIRKYNLKGTEEILRQEAHIKDEPDETTDNDVNSVISTLNDNLNDPENYENAYIELQKFVDDALDIYKHELTMILYPIFVHIFFKLMNNGYEIQAQRFLEKYGLVQEYYYHDDIKQLSLITKQSHMNDCDIVQALESDKFTIRISRDSLSMLKRHIHDKKLEIISQIINKYIYFDLYEGAARSKVQCESTAGAILGEAKRQDNKIRVYYGLLKEIDFQTLTTNAPAAAAAADDEEEADPDAPDKPKKKKAKKDPLFSKKSKSDPNAPPHDRIPLPELKDAEKLEKIKALREASKRVYLGKNSLPSVCFYTVLNAINYVTCAEISDDSSLLAVGFADSIIKVWSLTPSKLREIKPVDQLKEIDRDAEDIMVRMMDDRTAETLRILHGHSGPIYRCSFSPDKLLMLSCSEDTTIRLWSFHTWTCVVVYKGHEFPVWDVRFSPHGYYFATCSNDKTARLWATDSHQPLRIFAGHLSDVDVVQFHPNSNYIASGSSDRTVRLWDCLTGNYVRLMTGHKAPIYSLAFSICGRYLASGSADHNILIWDLQHGQLVISLTGHSGTIHSLCFSRDGNILTTGGLDCALKIWDFSKLCEDYIAQSSNASHGDELKDSETYLLRSFPTKSSPFITLHFTRRNLLLAVGMFKANTS